MKHHTTTTAQPEQLTARDINIAVGETALVGWIVGACIALACWLAR